MIKFPEHAPFSPQERGALEQLVSGMSPDQQQWLSGFLAASAGVVTAGGVASTASQSLTVLYGTESGNSEDLADLTAKVAKKRGLKARMVNMSEITPADLAKVENLLVIVSTWGEGDPPETAGTFYHAFMSEAPRLESMRFSVCALGDTSYEDFCEIGKQMDRRLEELGAQRVTDRKDCDVDFEEPHAEWLTAVLNAFGSGSGASASVAAVASSAPGVAYGKRNPFPAQVLEQVLLNGKGSKKETWHIELGLEGSGLSYEVGDSLAVVPHNATDVVDAVLKATGLNGDAEVTLKEEGAVSLREAMGEHLDITALSRAVAKKYQALTGSAELAEWLSDGKREDFRDYAEGRQIVDLLEDFPLGDVSAQDFVGALRSMPPRLYSIASSPEAHQDEVHLTVAAVRYQSEGRERKGVASTYLPDIVSVGGTVDVFVQPNKRFRLPKSDETPIIMVGPGTGIAPFRAFVEERAERGASGGSWLVFGDQHYMYDFLYQLEWQDYLKSGALTRLDVAFSRDQPEKVYVQQRLRENAAELFAWLEKGAHFYVCGNASHMAVDVHEALLEVLTTEGGMSREEAEAYAEKLKKDGRYQRDVY